MATYELYTGTTSSLWNWTGTMEYARDQHSLQLTETDLKLLEIILILLIILLIRLS